MGPQPVRDARRRMAVVKVGLIARCEIARGIAIQSKGFYDNMPVDKVLLVRMPRPDCREEPDWYRRRHRTEIAYDPRAHQLDEGIVRAWLRGLDVVFAVETPGDWRMPLWCRQMGVKLIVQGNPEFVQHHRVEGRHHPDAWWWPTSWKPNPERPNGLHMPVPMPDVTPEWHGPFDSPMRVLHVIGKRAHADRNGSDPFFQAMRFVRQRIDVTVYALDGATPQQWPNSKVKMRRILQTVPDRWAMYQNQDVLVLPRRYGGLCLPALEAAACGVTVMMSDTEPNAELAHRLIKVRRARQIDLACGRIKSADCSPRDIAEAIDQLAKDGRPEPWRPVLRWSQMRPRYLQAMEELCKSN